MSTSFGRTATKVLPIIAIAALGAATLAKAGPVMRSATLRPLAQSGAVAPRRPGGKRVKVNAGSGPAYYAGGATLPAVAYYGAAQAIAGQPTSANPGIAPGVGTTGTVFGYFASTFSPNHGADTLSYCQTGSGFGKSVINGSNQTTGTPVQNADLPCAALGVKPAAHINGFGAVGQPFADFAGADAPLSSSEYGLFVTNAGTTGSSIFGRGQAVQIPYLIGSIAILYNNANVTSQLNLTTAQVCKIFSGYITDWSQLGFPGKTLKAVVRSDNSGTSFSIANHLNATCAAVVRPNNFSVSQTFDEYIPGNPSIGVLPNPLNAGESLVNFIGSSGNPGVVTSITTTDGAIGYVEAANALSVRNGGSINFAKVNGKDPIADLPKSAGAVLSSSVLQSAAIGSDVQNGRAPVQSLSPADNCVLLVNPVGYAKPPGYPIIGVTNLELSSAGNGANVNDLRSLATMLVSRSPEAVGPGKITSIDLYGRSNVGTTGYSTLNQASFGSIIRSTATVCIGA